MSVFGRQQQRNDRRKANRWIELELLESRVALSTFRVNTLLDTVAVNLKTGQDASGHISLRSAIMAANAKPDPDTIILPAGTFTLTIPEAGDDDDSTGDLDIDTNVTIKGKGAGATIIDGNFLDRDFHIFSGKVTISGVTIEHGNASDGDGGGILNSGGKVTLSSVDVVDNVARGFGYSKGTGSSGAAPAGKDGLPGGNGSGGGIFNAAGSLTIMNSLIKSNSAIGGNGEIGGEGLDVTGANGKTGQSGQAASGAGGGSGGEGGQAFGGGNVSGGNGGASGLGGSAYGGGFADDGIVTLNPRLGAKKRSNQAKATDTVTANFANGGQAGPGGDAGGTIPGGGGAPSGSGGRVVTAGERGSVKDGGVGSGGGAAVDSDTTYANTNITGNHASTSDPEVNTDINGP